MKPASHIHSSSDQNQENSGAMFDDFDSSLYVPESHLAGQAIPDPDSSESPASFLSLISHYLD